MLTNKLINQVTVNYSTTGQVQEGDMPLIEDLGFKTIVCFRPNSEDISNQPDHASLKIAARKLNLNFINIPIIPGKITSDNINQFYEVLNNTSDPILGYCQTGNRAKAIFEAVKVKQMESNQNATEAYNWKEVFDVVVVGGGSAGIGVTASLLKRRKSLRIAVIEPSENHYYQPSWTLVGGGAFNAKDSVRTTKSVMPKQAQWIQNYVEKFDPDNNQLTLNNGNTVKYHQLIVCPGLRLAWEKIEGLQDTIGKNGVTSNYDIDHAQYTWKLVKNLSNGKAIFTQPPMPIKCAGAPQKAMYLSCSHWRKNDTLRHIEVEFNTATPSLFGVADFVPPLMKYIKRYSIDLNFSSNLVKVDGQNKTAWFEIKQTDGKTKTIAKKFSMLHVVPPQTAPKFIQTSKLADSSGWLDVNQVTLQHSHYKNIFGLGDVINSPNAKTAAAARKQIVVVANNLIASKETREMTSHYDGYGACPLTVEHGKVVLAEFGFGGKLLPTFPFLNPPVASRFSWFLKVTVMPWLYWNLMLKGIEWLAKPTSNKG